MAGVISAAVIGAAVIGAVASKYQTDAARKAAGDQNNLIKEQQAKQEADLAWQKKKKQQNDILSANNALRLRENAANSGAGLNQNIDGLSMSSISGLGNVGMSNSNSITSPLGI